MLPALIHPEDLRLLVEKARERGGSVLSALLRGRTGRTTATWNRTDAIARQWTAIPVLQERIRRRITGDPHVNVPAYISANYGDPEKTWRALSLGCGTGRKELAWFAAGGLTQLDAYDIAGKRIEEAKRLAVSAGMENQVRFQRADARYLNFPRGTYDLIIFDDALHHFTPLKPLLHKIQDWLRPEGLLVVNEYVGPNRFQWTDRQLEIANALREELPARMRAQPDGSKHPPIHRPGTLSMIMYDPSEAAESASILPELHRQFIVQEETLYGGALLHLVFKDLGHLFLQPDEEALDFLRRCIDAEDEAMQRGEIGNDFAFLVARPSSFTAVRTP